MNQDSHMIQFQLDYGPFYHNNIVENLVHNKKFTKIKFYLQNLISFPFSCNNAIKLWHLCPTDIVLVKLYNGKSFAQ